MLARFFGKLVYAYASTPPLTHPTGWRRCIGCLKLHVSFRKRATSCRALLQKMTYEDKVSYASLPPCTFHHPKPDDLTAHEECKRTHRDSRATHTHDHLHKHTCKNGAKVHMCTNTYIHPRHTHTYMDVYTHKYICTRTWTQIRTRTRVRKGTVKWHLKSQLQVTVTSHS